MYHASLAAGLAAKDMLTPQAAPQLVETTLRMAEERAAAAAAAAAGGEEDADTEAASTTVDAAAPPTKLNAEVRVRVRLWLG